MKTWFNIFNVIILIVGIMVIAFNATLYIACKQQRNVIDLMKDQQKIQAQTDQNQFKYQRDQIDHISNDLQAAERQIKDQNDALADQKDALGQEIEKRRQAENSGKNIQTSLVDIKAEADAIKQEMKGWQKDSVSVLAQLERKMDNSQDETKNLEENIQSLKAEIEKMTKPVDNST